MKSLSHPTPRRELVANVVVTGLAVVIEAFLLAFAASYPYRLSWIPALAYGVCASIALTGMWIDTHRATRSRAHRAAGHRAAPPAVQCRYCGERVRRDRRFGMTERVLLSWLPFRPYSCLVCARRAIYISRRRSGDRFPY